MLQQTGNVAPEPEAPRHRGFLAVACRRTVAARNKHALFPNEGGPAILELTVPASIMAILYADPIAAGLARSGEIRFEPESGLS